MRMGNKPDGRTGRFAPAAFGRIKARIKARARRRNRGLVLLAVATCLAVAGSGALLAHSWPIALSPMAGKTADPAPQKKTGHILISRSNSDLCDRYLLDNASGAMKAVDTAPCSQKRPDVSIVDQVNSFSSTWRGGR